MQALLSEQALFVLDDYFSLPKPAWLASVCDYRDHMQGAALCFWTEGEKHWFLFLYAMQSPQLAVFCPLTLESEYTLLPQVLASPSADLVNGEVLWSYVFSIDVTNIVTSEKFPGFPDATLLVHPGMVRLAGSFVGASCPLLSFPQWLQQLDPCRNEADPNARQSRKKTSEETIREAVTKDLLVSWSFEDYGAKKGMWADKPDSSSPAGSSPTASPFMPAPGDDTLQDLFDALEKMQSAFFLEGDGTPEAFKVSLLKGEWTETHLAKVADAFQGRARGANPVKWCQRHGLNYSSRYSLDEWTPQWSSAMALEWCRRMQYLYDISVHSHEVRHDYTEEELAGYHEPLFFARWADTLTGDKADRAAELRGLRPT